MNEATHNNSIRNCGHGNNFFCGVWGDMAWVNFVLKVIGVDMGLQ
jgi:hypothetical protein